MYKRAIKRVCDQCEKETEWEETVNEMSFSPNEETRDWLRLDLNLTHDRIETLKDYCSSQCVKDAIDNHLIKA